VPRAFGSGAGFEADRSRTRCRGLHRSSTRFDNRRGRTAAIFLPNTRLHQREIIYAQVSSFEAITQPARRAPVEQKDASCRRIRQTGTRRSLSATMCRERKRLISPEGDETQDMED